MIRTDAQPEAVMKVIYGVFLVLFVAAVTVFAYQNNRPETVTFLNQSWEISFPLLAAGLYVLGMLTGWSVVGLLRRSWRRVTAEDHARR
jgi:putative membrane protein